jgi:NADPH2:quinone reductase
MQAVQFCEYGPSSVLKNVEIECAPVGPNEVRIRINAAGVNPADVKWRAGMFREFMPLALPCVPGYDVAGTVEAVGPGVTHLSIGEPVAAMLDSYTMGAYAQQVVVSAYRVARLPSELDLVTAAALPTAGLTGLQLIEDHIRPKRGQTILVTGATGAVGRFAMFAALHMNVRVVAAVRASQIDSALAVGADAAFILGSDSWSGAPFDHIVDTVGGAEVAKLCIHLAPGGRIRTVATTPIETQGLSELPELVIVRPDSDRLAQLARDVLAGYVEVPISHRLPLQEAALAHDWVENGGLGGKIVLLP